jgi:hypothetical protein
MTRRRGLVGALVDLGDLSRGPRRPRDRRRTPVLKSGNTSQLFSCILTCARCWRGPTRAPRLINQRARDIVPPSQCLATTDDRQRWEPCGIPSSWHRPTMRLPGGSIPAHRRTSLPSLPPGSCVVALGQVDGMPHPAHPPNRAWRLCRPSRRSGPPGEGMFCVGWAAFADVAPLRQCQPGL